jgi:probable HAF family extracellular repeat protein
MRRRVVMERIASIGSRIHIRALAFFCSLVVALGPLSGSTLAQHGRPPMVYEVVSITANVLPSLPGGDESEARDINSLGEVVGWSTTSTGYRHAFKRGPLGAMLDLGVAWPSRDSFAEGINDNSEVVGYRSGTYERGFYWSQIPGWINLSAVDPPDVGDRHHYRAFAINNLGRIVGRVVKTSQYDSLAVTWWHRSADPALLHPVTGDDATWALGVSDSGWIAGIEADYGFNKGFRYRLGNVEYPLDPSPFSVSETVRAVNEAGTVVGRAWYGIPTGGRAIRWRLTGNPLVLGLLPGGFDSEAFDINEKEFIVGHGDMKLTASSETRVQRAFLFHIEFGMIELPPPASHYNPFLTECHANALNDRKDNGLVQVAGYCVLFGKKQAVRWDVIVGEHPE